ncbi:MAG TPA: hypothetical protein DF984_04020 [Anaerolineaceae bacterium]|nr:hypothetical protein [Anaerolineaceae bacterium]
MYKPHAQKARSPQTNGIDERLHKTIKLEFFKIVFRKKINTSLVELQQDLDQYMIYYNCKRPHSSRHYDGRTSA